MSTTPSPFTRHIAATLRAERARRRIPAPTVARSMGVSPAQAYKILGGGKPITMDQLHAVCQLLGLDMAAVVAAAQAATLPLAAAGTCEDCEGEDCGPPPLDLTG